YWHAMARNIEPRNGIYYWREGVIWRDQATTLQDSKAAKRTDELFTAGMNVNPYDIANHIERIRLHRDHRNLLEKPAALEELLVWAERVYARSPHSRGVQLEYVHALAFSGKTQKALLLAKQMQSKNPGSKVIKKLISDLEQGGY
ncbi:MAG: hypothetical protein Q8N12_02965, partial [Thermodesulfovibrionales bacterium]|nr:hypothetical protein [Thermodesulfovibrionales bacterium]